jgi:uncharacterized protein (TIGR02145 family)
MIRGLLMAIFAFFLFACGGEEAAGLNSHPVFTVSSSSEDPFLPPGGGESSSGTAAEICLGAHCCNGMPFDNSTNFCYKDELYPRCGNADYNPFEKGCFEGRLYNRCILPSTRGTCVHESLLRCRQEGDGEEKIIKPQPGMKCEDNGKITGTTLDISDNGRVYKIVQIGNQMWLAENVKNPGEGNSKCYEDKPDNCETYGRLYDWATAMRLPPECNNTSQSCPQKSGGDLWRGLCPPAFAIARTADWEQLIKYAGGIAVAGGRLKSASGWSSNGNGTDSYGFNAVPGGFYSYLNPEFKDGFGDAGSRTIWWHENATYTEATYTTIIASDTEAKDNFHQKGYNLAYIRCLHYF